MRRIGPWVAAVGPAAVALAGVVSAAVGLGAVVLAAGAAGAEAPPRLTLTLNGAETAGLCGFRALWDVPIVLAEDGPTEVVDAKVRDRGGRAVWDPAKRQGGARPGAIAFDALHRAVLVRFPGAAERIAQEMDKGYVIEKVELVLRWRDTELWPPGDPDFPPPEGGYQYRSNWGVDRLYRALPARWHAVGWALRRPWRADAALGPTFNAYVHGAGYWATYGAADEGADRFPVAFGPTEVSQDAPEGRMDVTAALTDAAFGATPGARLRRLADCGFLLRKWETYDHRYFRGVYEWATATGGRAILVRAPQLAVTLRPEAGAAKVGPLPPPADTAALARTLRETGAGGRPTAAMPTAEQIAALAARHRLARPPWMPEWQWTRVRELADLGDRAGRLAADMPFWCAYLPPHIRARMDRARPSQLTPEQTYARWIDAMLGKQPRGWFGFEGAEVLLPWCLYRDAMPAPVQDHWRLWWTAWLMPDRPTADLVHPMEDQLKRGSNTSAAIEGDSYYLRTGDWRGNKSFFRAGFNYALSTMNFNHSAAMGALLGGAVIGSDAAMADGRHGFERFPLRTWSWIDGTTQESIDHYYFAITLSAQKMIADFGPTAYDRLLGRMVLAKSVDELASAYHPGLRRFIAGSARTSLNHVLATQDGVYHILHTLSRRGVLHGLGDEPLPGGLPVIGQEVRPLRVALQTLSGPWGPEGLAATVDDKPLPFEMTATFTQWGTHREEPMWRRTYLGRHYGLYSQDVEAQFLPILAQWRRDDRPVEHLHERGTMLLRGGINRTQLVNLAAGWIKSWMGLATLQHRGKLVVLASPYAGAVKADLAKGVRSLQATVALYNHQAPAPTWSVYVDGRRVDALPCAVRQAGRITIRDGVTYIAVLPLPATDLGRDAEVVLSAGDVQEFEKKTYQAALIIDNYHLRREAPLAEGDDWEAMDRAWGGFVVEVADASEYPDFAAFQKHVAAARLDTAWDAAKAVAAVRYASGKDVMELGAVTTARADELPARRFAHRRVNGAWPYLAPGIHRETPCAVQGTTGRLEKGGAVLRCEQGRMAYLQTDPAGGTYVGHNPFPDLTHWSLEAPGGVEVTADGRVGLLRLTVRPGTRDVEVEHAFTDSQRSDASAAGSLLVFCDSGPAILMVDGKRLDTPLASAKVGGRTAYVIPIGGGRVVADVGLAERYRAARRALGVQ